MWDEFFSLPFGAMVGDRLEIGGERGREGDKLVGGREDGKERIERGKRRTERWKRRGRKREREREATRLPDDRTTTKDL